MKLSLLIPVLNYEEALGETIERLRETLGDGDVEILVVFDVTKPELREQVERLGIELAERFDVRSLVRLDERGFGSGLRYAAQHATGEALLPIMADLSDDVAAIPTMLQKIADGADVVVGARYVEGGRIVGDTPKQRLSRWYTRLMSTLTTVKCGDASNSFKMYRREVWEAVEPRGQSFDLSVELVVKAAALGYRIEQVPATWVNRQAGRSNFKVVGELWNYGRWLLFAMLRLPSRWVIVAGFGLPLLVSWAVWRKPLARASQRP